MEGFLNKKARGEKTIFARHEWSRRWFVLDGQILEYFESFDVKREKPIHSKVSSTGSPLRSFMLQPLDDPHLPHAFDQSVDILLNKIIGAIHNATIDATVPQTTLPTVLIGYIVLGGGYSVATSTRPAQAVFFDSATWEAGAYP